MPVFTHELSPDAKQMKIKLAGEFTHGDWNELVEFYKSQIAAGVLDYELDLLDVGVVNSMFIGMIIALNTSAMAHGGRVNVACRKDSAVSNQIRMAKIDQIVTVRRE